MSNTPIKPFWSWNDKLEKAELEAQIEAMHKAGIEGFFMHARGGLITEYMGEEWFDMIKVCMDKADELGMEAWAYDENGWPSGFANGIVPQTSVDYQQKWMLCGTVEDINDIPDNVLGFYRIENGKAELLSAPEKGCTVISYDIGKYYIDTFNSEAIDCFIENVHEKYYERFGERFGSSLKGFFTDEPQYGNHGHAPWSHLFPEIFEKRFGYALIPELPKLYFELDGFEAFRADFYNMGADTFRESFMKKMYDWCEEHNCKLTGHMMNEHSLYDQMRSTLGVTACYEYFHEPGVDWLCRKIESPLNPKQLGSAALQLGRKTLTESFALCGWDVSLNELKWISQWQYVNGVTGLCPHLEGYTLRGYRKRDYPASLFTQLPWFEDVYPHFSKYATAIGDLLDSGKDSAPILMVHPLQSAYIVHNPHLGNTVRELDIRTTEILDTLAGEHILHHYGDEVLMEHLGSVEKDTLKVGLCSYKAVLLPELTNIKASTVRLLNSFAANGGKIYALSFVPSFADGRKTEELAELCRNITVISSVSELRSAFGFASIESEGKQNYNIHYAEKCLEGGTALHYLVNLSKQPQDVKFSVDGEFILSDTDFINDKDIPVCCSYENGKTTVLLHFEEYASYALKAVPGRAQAITAPVTEKLQLDKMFDITSCTDNCLTLDFCEYSINGGEWQSEKAVIVLQRELLALKKPCDIALRFKFTVENGAKIGSLALCAETPESFEFEINGKPFKFEDIGYFTDKSFRKCDISALITEGENSIVMRGKFYQNDNVYRVLFTPGVHEVERNKLTYDTELESIYLVGDFGVKSADSFTLGDRKAIFTGHSFSLTSPVKTVDISNITVQGYWFFAGRMSLSQKVNVSKKEGVRYILELSELYSPAAELYINGKKACIFAFAPHSADVTDLLSDGENEITLRLLSGNRNLLGPHHKPYGECYSVSPATFTDEGYWRDGELPPWTDNYSFVLFGARL